MEWELEDGAWAASKSRAGSCRISRVARAARKPDHINRERQSSQQTIIKHHEVDKTNSLCETRFVPEDGSRVRQALPNVSAQSNREAYARGLTHQMPTSRRKPLTPSKLTSHVQTLLLAPVIL